MRHSPRSPRHTASTRAGAGTAVALGVLATAMACGGPARVQRCGEIQAGGCPAGRGGTCDDATCAALYDCVDGEWIEVEDCDREVGQGGSGGGGGEGGCEIPQFDRTGERTGCTPGLLHPDCPAAAAETCAPCLTDCVDFWLCREQGWEPVAYCDEDGALVLEDSTR